MTQAFVTKIDFEGKRAVGVTYRKDGHDLTVTAAKETILSTGALRTPQLLQLSGIGPAELLKQHGIEVVHELKGVGEHLMDHIQVGRVFTTSSKDTFNAKVGNKIAQGLNGIKYLAGSRSGPLTIGASLAGSYLKTDPELEEPNLQLHFLPFMPGDQGWDLADKSGFRLAMYEGRPQSRGFVRITSADPTAPADITFNHLSSEKDQQVLIKGMRIAQDIAAAMPAELNIKEIEPGPLGASDEDLLDYMRTSANTGFHYAGTARIGTDELAVVDPQLRVRGVERLRVVDVRHASRDDRQHPPHRPDDRRTRSRTDPTGRCAPPKVLNHQANVTGLGRTPATTTLPVLRWEGCRTFVRLASSGLTRSQPPPSRSPQRYSVDDRTRNSAVAEAGRCRPDGSSSRTEVSTSRIASLVATGCSLAGSGAARPARLSAQGSTRTEHLGNIRGAPREPEWPRRTRFRR